jgi:hypothetical protein
MKLARLTATVLSTLIFAGVAGAQPATTDMKFLGLGHPSAVVGGVYGGVYQADWNGTITGSNYVGGSVVDIVCVDMLNDVSNNQMWHAWTQNLGPGGADRTYLRWGGFSDWLTRYRRAAWLSVQMKGFADNSLGVKAIHTAIWRTFTNAQQDGIPVGPGSPYGASPAYGDQTVWSAAENWINQSVTAEASITATNAQYWSNFTVLSDVAMQRYLGPASQWNPLFGGTQEFITAPEPASLLMVATGLLGLGVVVRRKKRNPEAAA